MRPINKLGVAWLVTTSLGLTAWMPCNGQVPDNVLGRTVSIRVGSVAGTAFTLDVDGRQYLVTAKHVVASVDNAMRVGIDVQRKSLWSPIQVIVYKCDDPVDVAILIPPAQVTPDLPLEPDATGLSLGQDAYFVGYTGAQVFAPLTAVVRKATVAQIERVAGRKSGRILLDAHATAGLSGSPLTYRSTAKSGSGFNIAAVVVGFEPEEAPVLRRREVHLDEMTAEERARSQLVYDHGKWYRLEDSGDRVQLNTGTAVAWDIASAVDLIRRHPLGPSVSPDFQ